jgi:SAM-dependent methyltransferase
LARATHWGDPDGRLCTAIQRGLRGIVLGRAHSDPGKRVAVTYDTLLVRMGVAGGREDTGYWSFKLGLALRAFNAIRQVQASGAIALDQETTEHLGALSQRAIDAIQPCLREADGGIEALTSLKSAETNSETQPWVALGLEPAIEWQLFGAPPASERLPIRLGHDTCAPPVAPDRVYFDKAAPQMLVETVCDESQAARLLDRVATTWEDLGAKKPHWSVLTEDQFMPARIAGNEAAFHASGEHDANRLLAAIRRVGRDPARFERVFDYGCGLGRVANHLAQVFASVTGCDVSASHLELARERSRKTGRSNIEYRLSRPPAFGMTEDFDLWYSLLVLQHNPPPVTVMILKRALSALRPDGLAVFQLPTYAPHYRFEVDEYLASKPPASGIEMHFLPQPALFALIQACSCTVLEVIEDGLAGDPTWISNSLVVAK